MSEDDYYTTPFWQDCYTIPFSVPGPTWIVPQKQVIIEKYEDDKLVERRTENA